MEEKLWNSNYIKIWIGNFLVHFSFSIIVPLLPLYLTDRFGASKDTIGLVLAGYIVMALVVRPFSGYILDNFRRKTVLVICNFLFFSVFAGYLVAGSLTLFAIFRTIHGLPFGATAVAMGTVAIDTLPSSRRNEGIGLFGLSNNIATAIAPALAMGLLHRFGGNFQLLFWISLLTSFLGMVLDASIKLKDRQFIPEKKIISLDRFFLLKGIPEAAALFCWSTSFGIVSTYVAIYGREKLDIDTSAGFFFTLLAIGLIVSRLTGVKALREGRISQNACAGMFVSLFGYLFFALLHNRLGYFGSALVIGLGNGHMFPAMQNIFINLAENSQRGTATSSIQIAWDAGIGIGMLVGGLFAEHLGYNAAFLAAAAVNALGVAWFFFYARNHFEKNKLR